MRPHTAAIIQARMGSKRLPGKVLLPLGGRPLLEHIVRNTQRAREIDDIIVATTSLPEDLPVLALAERLGVIGRAGAVDDALDRYHEAAAAVQAQTIVRLTGDNPLVDGQFIDHCVATFNRMQPLDYLDTATSGTFPIGIAVEVIRRRALEIAWRDDLDPARREHVTPYLRQHLERFRGHALQSPHDYGQLRFTVDTKADLKLMAAVFERLDLTQTPRPWEEIATWVQQHPSVRRLNAHIKQRRAP